MLEGEKTIVEINGVKMEIDLRHATVIHDKLRIGSKVKILAKGGYSGHEVYPGVIVGFEPFTDLPTIVVAYVITSYSKNELAFATINAKSADKWDFVPSLDDELPIEKADVLATFDREIQKKRTEIDDIESKRAFFLKHFDKFFINTNEEQAV